MYAFGRSRELSLDLSPVASDGPANTPVSTQP
ncbi:hypothetical protein SAMN06298212_10317 [Ruaniaceae bacterium KH17]|nr:hypothetical protein SAMN06298212_10317 [Ruaniaceae bacterium KH17]